MLEKIEALLNRPKLVADIQRQRGIAKNANQQTFSSEFSQRNFTCTYGAPRYTDLTVESVNDSTAETNLPVTKNSRFFAGKINFIDITISGFVGAGVIEVDLYLWATTSGGSKLVHREDVAIDGNGTFRIYPKQYDFVIATHLLFSTVSGTFSNPVCQINATGWVFSSNNS